MLTEPGRPTGREQIVAEKHSLSDRRRQRGSGGVKAVREGVFLVDIEISRDPITGQRRRISRQIRGTREDAEVALAKLKVADSDGRAPRPGTKARTVRAALDDYVADAEAGIIELAPKTVVTSRSARNTMCAIQLSDGRNFGSVRLSSLTWQDIEDMFRIMRRACGASWVRRAATVLSQGLERARKHGLIEYNPARDAARPRMVRKKPHSPPIDEVTGLIAQVALVDDEIADATTILAATGMRLGELLGLQWPEVDFAADTLHVAWAISDGGRGVKVVRKPTKRSDWRDVPLTAGAKRALQRQAERCRNTFGVAPGPGIYVLPNRLGPDLPHRPDSFGDRFAVARGTYSTTFLHLRHFTATTMLDAGEAYRTVADILGNSENTLRLHYDGRTNLDKKRAISALEF
jgi:integrase